MLATYHVICAFPNCGHTAVMKQSFDWPMAATPEAEIPQGWSIVLRRHGDAITTITICCDHDFAFDGMKCLDINPIGFNLSKESEPA